MGEFDLRHNDNMYNKIKKTHSIIIIQDYCCFFCFLSHLDVFCWSFIIQKKGVCVGMGEKPASLDFSFLFS